MKVKLVSKGDYKELERLYREFEVSDDGDICIAVGGDGTFVKASREYDGPILSIRTGESNSLGFCADVTLEDMDFVVDALKKGKYTEETVGNKLEINYMDSVFYATNEVVMKNVKDSVYFRVYRVLNGRKEPFYNHAIGGDGLLVSTAFGSTAYNRNAGGIITNDSGFFCVTFLNCGGTFSHNPVIMDKNNRLYIEVVKGRGSLGYDNAEMNDVVLGRGDGFYVQDSGKPIRMIKFDGKRESFADKMQRLAEFELYNNI